MTPVSRRKALRHLAVMAPVGWAAGCSAPQLLLPRPGSDVVRRENDRPGTRDWMLERTAVDKETGWRSAAIEGYCSHTRVFAGEGIDLHVSTDPAEDFDVESIGWATTAGWAGVAWEGSRG